jgi:hypothetical protein
MHNMLTELSLRLDLNLVTNNPATEKALSLSTDVGLIVRRASRQAKKPSWLQEQSSFIKQKSGHFLRKRA